MEHSKKATNYIKKLGKIRSLLKNENLKYMLKFQERQNKIKEEDTVEIFSIIGHSLPTTVNHKLKEKNIIKII